MNLLHVDASILGPYSITREVSAAIVARLAGNSGQNKVIYRDLAKDSPPHLTLASLPTDHPRASLAGPLDAAAQLVRDESQRMLEEFLAADVVVIGAPMYNFSLPSQLKAWIDRIAVPGKTFRYGPGGVEGLAGGKRLIVALARGGVYGPGAPAASAEHVQSYLRAIFGFLGITDPEFVLVEGIAAGDEVRTAAIAAAHDAVGRLAA